VSARYTRNEIRSPSRRLSRQRRRRSSSVTFTGHGCTLSQATASLLTEQMTGTPVPEIAEWDGETLEELVGMELTSSRLKCAELALVAFRQAVADSDRDDLTVD